MQHYLTESRALIDLVIADTELMAQVDTAADGLYDALTAGGTLYAAGNGGSAAEAAHLTGEFVGRFRRERRGFSAVALTAEAAAMTAIGNDYGYEEVFARQLTYMGKPGDVFVALSTSGNSANIIAALTAAKKQGMKTIALSGKGGGKALGMADIEIIIPSMSTARIQEMHLLIIHSICEKFDDKLLGPEDVLKNHASKAPRSESSRRTSEYGEGSSDVGNNAGGGISESPQHAS